MNVYMLPISCCGDSLLGCAKWLSLSVERSVSLAINSASIPIDPVSGQGTDRQTSGKDDATLPITNTHFDTKSATHRIISDPVDK